MFAGSDISLFAGRCDDNAPMLARKHGVVSQGAFLAAVAQFGAALPDAPLAMNVCADRAAFMIAFCAVLARGGTTLLPQDTLPLTLARTREHWPGAGVIVDRIGGAGRAVGAEFVCDAATLFASADAAPRVARTPAERSAAGRPAAAWVAADHVAAVPCTSGSTGAPQPQPKRWGAMHVVAAATEARFFPDLPRYSVVATVPSQHMYGLEMTLLLALHGRALVAAERPLLPAHVAAALRRVPAPRVLVTTPVHLRALVRSGQQLPALARIISATAPLSATLATLTEARLHAEVHEIYGCTEAGALATRRTVSGDVWQLLDGITIGSAAGDDTGMVAAPHLGGAVLLPDRIACVDSHRFRLLGRRGDLVNVGGKRASLAELNHRLLEVPGVLDGVIFAPEDGGDEIGRLRGMVVTDGRSERAVLRDLAMSIDAVFLPRPFHKVDAIARTATGKIQRAAFAGASSDDD